MTHHARQQRHASGTRTERRRRAARKALSVCLVGLTLVLSACGSMSRPVRTDAQLAAYAEADKEAERVAFREAIQSLLARTDRRMAAAELPTGPTTIDLLAISGGGDFGAFGAGLLVGWGEVKDAEWARPDFDTITGVSTSALLAPFAYVGTQEALLKVEDFYRNPRKDWVKSRGLLFFLPNNSSFMQIDGLARDIRSAVDRDFVAQIADRSREGKVLAVSATDLDLGRQRFWNVGFEAETATASGDPDRVQRILIASAAIPAVFPPVDIDGSLYADGGVTANVFLRLDPHSPDGFLQQWWKRHPGVPVPRVRYWVIVNNTLNQTPKTVQPRWPGIVGPKAAEGRIERTEAVVFSGDETADVGIDLATPVVEAIGAESKSRFTGHIPSVIVETRE